MARKFEFDPRFQRRLKAAAAPANVCLPDLFPDDFMQRHSELKTLQEFFDAAPVQFDSSEEAGEYLTSPPPEWDAYVASVTDFLSWQAMIEAAGLEEIQRRFNAI